MASCPPGYNVETAQIYGPKVKIVRVLCVSRLSYVMCFVYLTFRLISWRASPQARGTELIGKKKSFSHRIICKLGQQTLCTQPANNSTELYLLMVFTLGHARKVMHL